MHDNTEARWHEALENQADVVGRPQVLRAGISRNVVRRRLGAGRWQRLHRGVYATFSGPRPRVIDSTQQSENAPLEVFAICLDPHRPNHTAASQTRAPVV